jgi:hypothetical protein
VKESSGEWTGPVSLETLQMWVGSGKLQPDVLLREDGKSSFAAAYLHPNLYFPNRSSRAGSPAVPRDPPIRDERLRRFSWSAFTFTWLWGLYHRKPILLLLIPLGLIAQQNSIFLLFINIWIGTQGNQWAWESERFATLEAMEQCENAWHRAAMWALGISLILSVLILVMISGSALSTPSPQPRPQTPIYRSPY